jgi:hypothetical protein
MVPSNIVFLVSSAYSCPLGFATVKNLPQAVNAALWHGETGVVWFGIGSPQASSPVSVAQLPQATSSLHPGFGSQLKAGATPPQLQRLVRVKGVARARGARSRVKRKLRMILDLLLERLVGRLMDVEEC